MISLRFFLLIREATLYIVASYVPQALQLPLFHLVFFRIVISIT